MLWDTCKYIRRMDERLRSLPHESEYEMLLYRHGTHFVFPEEMIKRMFPVGSSLLIKIAFRAARQFPKECSATRIDIDEKLSHILAAW